MAEAGEHLDAILLDLLPGAAAVALLAAAEVVVDRVPVEDEAGGQAAQDGDQRRPVRLTCRCQAERHAANPSALRMTSTGARMPVQSSNDAAPWAARTSSPEITAPSAARAVAVSGYGRSTSVCPAPSSTSTSSRSE